MDPRSKLRSAIAGAVKRAASSRGYEVIRQDFYSPMPELDSLPNGLWPDALRTPGIDLRLDSGVSLVNELRPLMADFVPPRRSPAGGGFYLDNGMYESVDAETLYGMVRHLSPQNIVELGSGASSHVIALARDNLVGPSNHHIFDPYPFTASVMGAVNGSLVQAVRAEDLVPDDLSMLGAGDILFIDTTHTVRTGGDCSNIFLRLLPTIPVGVFVHVHDIFMPFEYPREWIMNDRRAWAEQYLLQAFLAFNTSFEVTLPNHALARLRTDALSQAIPSFSPSVAPGAFWFRRTA